MNFKGKNPIIDPTCFIASGSKIVGDVRIKENVSVWFNAVIRADISYIIIGENTNIQDNVCIHVNYDVPTIIGKNVTIGHGAIIHAATIKENALIGMGSIILDGAIIEENAIVAAGCVVPPNKVVPKNTLVVGNPMKVIREIDEKTIKSIKFNKDQYVKLSKEYKK